MADYTKEQLAAIESKGKTIVSASAGSGKTTVMIEKIIRLICDDGDVSKILAVTFTKKAASQMKEKLRKALVKAINEQGIDLERKKRLKAQLDEVSSADISTIHSFCAKLIRTHFYFADVDNAFRVINGDDAEGTAMQHAALDELLEEGYESQDDKFMRLLSVYWRRKSDNTFRQMILDVYKELRNRADYKEYLQNAEYTKEVFDAVCGDLHALLKEKCRYYLDFVDTEKVYFENEQKAAQLALANELEEHLSAILQTENYFAACALKKGTFTTNRTSKKDSDDLKMHAARLGELKTKIVKIYDEELAETGLYDEELQAFLSAGEIAKSLGEQILKFDEKYAALKKERGALDYNDLEHVALALLKNEEVAKEVRGKYLYVFVDEYQDVNPVQEEIISLIGGKNLFLVGDVKQSIYGFRGSKSKFFVEKQKEFENGGGESLVMKRNFRSADAVLNAVNSQFSLAMTKDVCSVDYVRDSYMEKGGRYALNDGRVQIHLLSKEEKTEKGKRGIYSVKANADKKNVQESVTAKTLKKIIDEELGKTWYDADKGEYRRVQYSDIAILSRKKQGKIAVNVAALSDLEVPITSVAAVNICEYGEVKTLIDILSLLDNFEQDVPLCSALLSTMGNLTADDLADIRLAYPNETFFRNACKAYATEKTDETAAKLRKFFAVYQEYRELSHVVDTAELLTKLISTTRMETRLLSRANGTSCLKRIHRFIEETSNPAPMCVHEFLERLRDLDYKIEFNENGGENSVKVLTMHSSKGLEYPVVILDDLNATFKGNDPSETLVEEKYGLATRAFDDKKMLKRGTLLRRLHTLKEMESSVADELNLYYVALTRAKFGLHLLFQKPCVLPDIRYARSFADFTDFNVWQEYIVSDELFSVPKQERSALAFHPNEALVQEIISAFTWEYAYGGLENLPVKSSATAIMANDATWVQETESVGGFVPEVSKERYDSTLFDVGEIGKDAQFLDADRERGIAYHAFLERFDFGGLLNENGKRVGENELFAQVDKTLESMKKEQNELVKFLEKDMLLKILQNPVFYHLQGYELYKERQFLVSLPIKDTYAKKQGYEHLQDRDGEEMIFQGAIDLLAVKEDEVLIIDYKYSKRDKENIKEHYKKQLELYRLATAKILRVPLEKIRCSIVNICRGFQVDID